MLGIVASKQTLSVSLRAPQEQTLLWQEEVPNNLTGCRKLHAKTPGGCAWVLEPTGRYGEARVRFAREREKGLNATAAYGAVAWKLARLSWALVHHERTIRRTAFTPGLPTRPRR
jgi:hypothetical protein